MKQKDFNEGLNHIDSDLVEEFIAKSEKIEKRNQTRGILIRVGALAACLCLIVTGVFGGVGLLKDRFSDATAPTTQNTPDLPLDFYPSDYTEYANVGMKEYLELNPEFFAYRYICFDISSSLSFAHLEILEVKPGYEMFLEHEGYHTFYKSASGTLLKCRVIDDAWTVLEPGTEITLFIEGTEDADYLSGFDSFFIKTRYVKNQHFYTNVSYDDSYFEKYGEFLDTVPGERFEGKVYTLPWKDENYNCFPVEDGKMQLRGLDQHLKKINFPKKDDIDASVEYAKIESILADGMLAETALENLRVIKEKYKTGEYHVIDVELLENLTYGEYCRMIKGTLTQEDFDKYKYEKFDLALEYAYLPGLVSSEFSLSDGTKFEISTRIKLSDNAIEFVESEIKKAEEFCTDKNGVLDVEACIEMIQEDSGLYSYISVLDTYDLRLS